MIRRVARGHGRTECPLALPFVLFVLALLLTYVLPFQFGVSGNYFNLRLALVAQLLVPVLLSGAVGDALGRRENAVAIAAAAILAAALWAAHVRFDAEARRADSALEAIAPKSRVLALTFDPSSKVFAARHWNQLFLHFHDYGIATKGGVDPYIHSWNPLLPFRLTGEALPAPGEYSPKRFRWSKHGLAYDYFLVRGTASEPVMKDLIENTDLVVSNPPWLLTKRR